MKFLKSSTKKQLVLKTISFSMLIGLSIVLIKTIMTSYMWSNPDILLKYNNLMNILEYLAIIPYIFLGIFNFKLNKEVVLEYANKKFIITSILIAFSIFVAVMVSVLGGSLLGLSLVPTSIVNNTSIFSDFAIFFTGGLFYYIPHTLLSFAIMFLLITNKIKTIK